MICEIECDYLKEKLDQTHVIKKGFFFILKLIFENNYFLFLNLFFKQLKGIAMGCKCGPNLANLFLYILEKHWYY